MNLEKSGFVFICCLLLGVGFGVLFGNVKTGGAIGLGLGIIAIALFRKGKR